MKGEKVKRDKSWISDGRSERKQNKENDKVERGKVSE